MRNRKGDEKVQIVEKSAEKIGDDKKRDDKKRDKKTD